MQKTSQHIFSLCVYHLHVASAAFEQAVCHKKPILSTRCVKQSVFAFDSRIFPQDELADPKKRKITNFYINTFVKYCNLL